MFDVTDRDAARAFYERHIATLAALPASPMQAAAMSALAIEWAGWAPADEQPTAAEAIAEDREFWAIVERMRGTPALTPADAAAKAVIVALLIAKECEGDAGEVAGALVADLAGM